MPMNGDDLDYFEGSLGNEQFVKEVGENIERRTQFINDLEGRRLSTEQLLKCIEKTKDNKVRTLLIYHLLCQKKHISRLEGNSILNEIRLNHEETCPSRLNALVHQIDITIISVDMIKKLTEEAAMTILCSVPHFHQLNEAQINTLIDHRLQEDTIAYWVNHYGQMPNASKMMVYLMKDYYSHIRDELKKEKNAAILDHIIVNLNAYAGQTENISKLPWKESHLILAIERYLNGHYKTANTDFIKLYLSKKSPSLKAVSLLFLLIDVDELQDHLENIIPVIKGYLKENAQSGSITPFYYNGTLQNSQMLHTAPWNESDNRTDSAPDVYLNLKKSAKKTINFFEYFLIHYQGSPSEIGRLMRHYLELLTLKKDAASLVRNLSDLLNDSVLCNEIKTELFNNLLGYPNLFDEHVNSNLFLYQAETTVKHFGLKGGAKNYQQVALLCDSVLNKEKSIHKPETLELAARARSEAAFELALSQNTWWFSGIYNYVKRSWFYGWQSFLVPNTPIYVASEPEHVEEAFEELAPYPEYIPDLSILVETKEQPTHVHFEQFIAALKQYSLQNIALEKEYVTRAKLHRFFCNALHTEPQGELAVFLNKNKTPFLQNQLRLVELALLMDTLERAKEFAQQVDDDQANFLRITYLMLDSEMPPLGPIPTTTETSLEIKVSGIIDQTTTTVTEAAHTLIATAPVIAEKTRSVVTSVYAWGRDAFFGGEEQPVAKLTGTNKEEPLATVSLFEMT